MVRAQDVFGESSPANDHLDFPAQRRVGIDFPGVLQRDFLEVQAEFHLFHDQLEGGLIVGPEPRQIPVREGPSCRVVGRNPWRGYAGHHHDTQEENWQYGCPAKGPEYAKQPLPHGRSGSL